MVLAKTVYNDPNYWDGGITGTKLSWGYTGYLGYKEFELQDNVRYDGENVSFNGTVRKLVDKLIASGGNFTNAKILELGGATGYISKIAKFYWPAITYDVIDISTYWLGDIEPTVDNYINDDIMNVINYTGNNAIKNNAYDVVISRLFLECLTDAELADVIPKLNSWTKTQQVHIVTVDTEFNQGTINAGAYNFKTLAEWAALGFEAGTILQDRSGNEVIV